MTKFKLTSWGYQIDFYNFPEEIPFLSEKLKIDKKYLNRCFLKTENDWVITISGMTFKFNSEEYYTRLKKYLDSRLNIHLRKEKILKIHDKI